MSDAPFELLKSMLKPHASGMHVKHDTTTNYYLEESLSSDKAQMFGAVQVKKNYTSFHLFPVYCHPDLLDGISPELKKRMQGKSCFNFKTADQVPQDELKALVEKSHESLSR